MIGDSGRFSLDASLLVGCDARIAPRPKKTAFENRQVIPWKWYNGRDKAEGLSYRSLGQSEAPPQELVWDFPGWLKANFTGQNLPFLSFWARPLRGTMVASGHEIFPISFPARLVRANHFFDHRSRCPAAKPF